MKKKQILVIGLGRFGASAAETFTAMGHDVLGVDANEERVNGVADKIKEAVIANAESAGTISSLGVENFDIALVAIGENMQANILVSLLLKEASAKKVVSRAVDSLHGKVLEKIGVDKVVDPESEMGRRLARGLLTTSVTEIFDRDAENKISEIPCPPEFEGRKVGEINLRLAYGINLLMISRGEGNILVPGAEDVLEKNDWLIIAGRNEDVDALS